MFKVEQIIGHWGAVSYAWDEYGHYHDHVYHDGKVVIKTPHNTQLFRAVAGRNSNTISISMICMGGRGFQDYPPTEIQIDSFCKYTAKVIKGYGWEKEVDKRFWTHAEVASNRDFPLDVVKKAQKCLNLSSPEQQDLCAQQYGLPTANYGPMGWFDGWPSGTSVRWDLAQLRPSDKMGMGGFELRERIKKWLTKL